jgi:Trm5-related predicted tRNA methylase
LDSLEKAKLEKAIADLLVKYNAVSQLNLELSEKADSLRVQILGYQGESDKLSRLQASLDLRQADIKRAYDDAGILFSLIVF